MSVSKILTKFLGNKNDLIDLPFTEIKSVYAFMNTFYLNAHGKPFVYPEYADPVELTSGSGTWSQSGEIIEIIPEGVLDYADFDMHGLILSDVSDVCYLQIDFFSGAPGSETPIGCTVAHRSVSHTHECGVHLQIKQQLKNTRISARVSDSTRDQITCGIKLMGHYYRS